MISKIKENINCIDYCQIFGISIINGRGHSLIGGNNPTCLFVENDFWYDFKMQTGGDVIDLCSIHKFNGDKSKAIHFLADYLGIEQSYKTDDWKMYMQQLGNQIYYWNTQLKQEHYDYLEKRRIHREYADQIKIGFNGHRLVIPYWNFGGYYPYYCTRAWNKDDDKKYMKMKKDDFNEHIIWGFQTLSNPNHQDLLVLAEGAFDAMSWAQEGYNVVSPITGHFNKEQLAMFLKIAKRYEKVLVIFDNDTAGNKFTMKISKILFENKIKFDIGHVPEPSKYKDVSDFYSDGNDLLDLIENAENGIKEMCISIKDKEEFKNFVYRCSRFISREDIAEIFDCVYKEEYFNKAWLDVVKKTAMSCPSEHIIVEEIIKKRKLKYREETGFYEYERGHWKLKNDTEILKEIGKVLGYWKTGSKIKTILSLLKSECVCRDEFDKKPLFSFINGTLDLETYEFREHRETDLCSIQVNYPYNPQKGYEEWQKFINEISLFNDSREALLQEMCGYILFPDCRFQCCFMLLGEGSNGKSVLIDTLEKIFGSENISNVPLSQLVNPFQLIQLSRSLINIGSETSTNVNGAETIMKAVTAGDTVSACYKNKPFINFKSRAKCIFLLNDMIQSKDYSYGFSRRLSFIKFEATFVDNPKKPNELKKDITIAKRFENNLSGIFNWVLEGYKVLKATNKITVTDDDKILKEDFQETINPVYGFFKDMDPLYRRTTNDELYEIYREWCDSHGHRPKNHVGFVREFKRVSEGVYVQYRTHDANNKTIRGFEPIKPC
ncbi:MAG: phage/plasmid primase, P4 family [Longibaculum sp.]